MQDESHKSIMKQYYYIRHFKNPFKHEEEKKKKKELYRSDPKSL